MSVSIDWADLIENLPETTPTRDLIPPDTYIVKVTKAEANLAKSGNGKIDLTMVVDEGQYRGRTVWGRINFATNSAVSMAITVEQLAQFGVTRTWLATNSPSNAQIAARLVNQRVQIKVTHREWEGTQYYDVKGFKAVESEKDPF